MSKKAQSRFRMKIRRSGDAIIIDPPAELSLDEKKVYELYGHVCVLEDENKELRIKNNRANAERDAALDLARRMRHAVEMIAKDYAIDLKKAHENEMSYCEALVEYDSKLSQMEMANDS